MFERKFISERKCRRKNCKKVHLILIFCVEIDEAPKSEKMIPTQEFLQKVIDLMDSKLKTILAKKPSSPPVVTMQDFNFSCDGSSLQNYRSSDDEDAVSKK
jgi:hypothetical protein